MYMQPLVSGAALGLEGQVCSVIFCLLGRMGILQGFLYTFFCILIAMQNSSSHSIKFYCPSSLSIITKEVRAIGVFFQPHLLQQHAKDVPIVEF